MTAKAKGYAKPKIRKHMLTAEDCGILIMSGGGGA